MYAQLIHSPSSHTPPPESLISTPVIAQRIGESLYRATLFAAGKLIVLIGSLLQLPFLVLQFILGLTGLDGEVVVEVGATRITERGATRADDRVTEAAMEDRKKEGYF